VYNFPKAHKKKVTGNILENPGEKNPSTQKNKKEIHGIFQPKCLPPPQLVVSQVPWLFSSSWRVPCDCTSVVHVNFHVVLTGLGIGLLVWKSSGFFFGNDVTYWMKKTVFSL